MSEVPLYSLTKKLLYKPLELYPRYRWDPIYLPFLFRGIQEIHFVVHPKILPYLFPSLLHLPAFATMVTIVAIRKDAGLCCGSRLRRGEVFAYVGLPQNLEDLKDARIGAARVPRDIK